MSTKIFISRKEEDKEIGRQIRDQLALYGGERLALYTADDIPPASDWINWIRTKLRDADLLILLFINPSATWDWCLYEVGLFTPLSANEKGAVICLHAPNIQPPAPLRNLQAVPAKEDAMRKFLRKFFGTTDIPGIKEIINGPFAKDKKAVNSLASFICDQIRPESPSVAFHNRYLNLTVNPKELQPDKIPEDSEIESDRISLDIFDLQEEPPGGGKWKWRQIVDWAKDQGDTAWLSEIAKSVQWACKGKVQRPIGAIITHPETNKTYRPNVHRRETHPNGLMTLQVLLIHQPSE